MKAVVSKERLLNAVTTAASVVDSKSDNPILKNVLLDVAGETLFVSGSHLTEDAVASCPVEVQSQGSVGVNAKDIVDRVKAMPPGPVTLSSDGSELKLQSGKRRHVLPTIAPDDFPRLAFPQEELFEVQASALASVLSRVRHCIDQDSTRPAMNGARIEFGELEIAAVATDGRALAYAKSPLGPCGRWQPILLPMRAVGSVLRLLADLVIVRIGVEGPRLWLQTEGFTYGAKLLEAMFPNYAYALNPDMRPQSCKVGKAAFVDACKSAALATDGKDTKGLLRFDFAPGVLGISGKGNGAAGDQIDAEYDGEESTVGGYAERIVAACAAVDGDDIRVCFGKKGQLHVPITILPEEGEQTLQLVMPANLQAGG